MYIMRLVVLYIRVETEIWASLAFTDTYES